MMWISSFNNLLATEMIRLLSQTDPEPPPSQPVQPLRRHHEWHPAGRSPPRRRRGCRRRCRRSSRGTAAARASAVWWKPRRRPERRRREQLQRKHRKHSMKCLSDKELRSFQRGSLSVYVQNFALSYQRGCWGPEQRWPSFLCSVQAWPWTQQSETARWKQLETSTTNCRYLQADGFKCYGGAG